MEPRNQPPLARDECLDGPLTRVLITGATGFLGSHLVAQCLADGHDVVGTFRHTPPNNRPDSADEITPSTTQVRVGRTSYVRVDLTDPVAVNDLFRETLPEAVVHLAAQSSNSRSWSEPIRTYRDNVVAQACVLEACMLLNPAPMTIIAGSCDEYGAASHATSVPETAPLAPLTPYAVSKAAQDLMARQYFAARQLPALVVRPFLQIGPGRSDTFFSGAFARQIVEIEMSKRPPVIEVGEIDLIRDMTDVRDVAKACALLLSTDSACGEAFNVCSGSARPVRALLNLMLELTGVDAEVRVRKAPHRSNEPPVLVGDPSKLKALTGWTPLIPFSQSAEDMLQDWRERLGP
jgi:GDP-4-dehydro-6-deoxy-D-mannose reductase